MIWISIRVLYKPSKGIYKKNPEESGYTLYRQFKGLLIEIQKSFMEFVPHPVSDKF